MSIIQQRDLLRYDAEVPHIIKYMGSKKQIIDFVIQGIQDSYAGGAVCDLFAGTSVLSGALRNTVPMISNDIQAYSGTLAQMYLGDYKWDEYPDDILEQIAMQSQEKAKRFFKLYPHLQFEYRNDMTLEEFQQIEIDQQQLIDFDFSKAKYHLYAKNYAGTYWSYEQCVWIDAVRSVADDYKNTPLYAFILSSLMFAMSYNSQSTGHYAQYRDPSTESSMRDIMIYRQKEILPYFIRKMEELKGVLGTNDFKHQVYSMDYLDCLHQIPTGTTVYADPPYCFVHYSRFYHAIETLVKYDYPEVKFKGRYRTDRHQSPFCIQTKVKDAFYDMFVAIRDKKSNLVLSYSNTGMIELDELIELTKDTFGNEYSIEVRLVDYLHSTMGRKEDKSRDVKECLVLIKKKA